MLTLTAITLDQILDSTCHVIFGQNLKKSIQKVLGACCDSMLQAAPEDPVLVAIGQCVVGAIASAGSSMGEWIEALSKKVFPQPSGAELPAGVKRHMRLVKS